MSRERRTTTEAGTVVREVWIAAAPETIFPFFTDPQQMLRWMGVSADLDPRPGGLYRCDVNGKDVARGEYVRIEPPHRIVCTWGWEGEGHPVPPGSSTVEVTLTPDGGGTLVRLTHRDLPEPTRGQHAEGWEHYLARLAVAAAGGDPGRDPWLQQEMPAS